MTAARGSHRLAVVLAVASLAACEPGTGESGEPPTPGARDSAASSSVTVPLIDSAFADSVDAAAAQRELLALRGRHTFLPELLSSRDGVNHRWKDRPGERMRVWVQELDATRRGLARRVVTDAFTDWAASGIPIAFTIVPDSTRAEVIVTWVDRFTERMTGVTRWGTDPDEWIVSARIELARHQPDGAPVDSATIAAIARHEVGHLLGLDHTSEPTSIMASPVRVTGLSEADRRTIRLVYELPAGRLPFP